MQSLHGGVSHHRTLPPKEARRILILFKQLLPKELTAMGYSLPADDHDALAAQLRHALGQHGSRGCFPLLRLRLSSAPRRFEVDGAAPCHDCDRGLPDCCSWRQLEQCDYQRNAHLHCVVPGGGLAPMAITIESDLSI